MTAGQRVTIEGEITRVKWPKFDSSSPWGDGFKVTVQAENGDRYFGGLPQALKHDVIDFGPRLANGGFNPKMRYGVVVRFDAEITASDSVDHFWFYSRPTKVSLVKAAA